MNIAKIKTQFKTPNRRPEFTGLQKQYRANVSNWTEGQRGIARKSMIKHSLEMLQDYYYNNDSIIGRDLPPEKFLKALYEEDGHAKELFKTSEILTDKYLREHPAVRKDIYEWAKKYGLYHEGVPADKAAKKLASLKGLPEEFQNRAKKIKSEKQLKSLQEDIKKYIDNNIEQWDWDENLQEAFSYSDPDIERLELEFYDYLKNTSPGIVKSEIENFFKTHPDYDLPKGIQKQIDQMRNMAQFEYPYLYDYFNNSEGLKSRLASHPEIPEKSFYLVHPADLNFLPKKNSNSWNNIYGDKSITQSLSTNADQKNNKILNKSIYGHEMGHSVPFFNFAGAKTKESPEYGFFTKHIPKKLKEALIPDPEMVKKNFPEGIHPHDMEPSEAFSDKVGLLPYLAKDGIIDVRTDDRKVTTKELQGFLDRNPEWKNHRLFLTHTLKQISTMLEFPSWVGPILGGAATAATVASTMMPMMGKNGGLMNYLNYIKI